ncbi:MAG: sterol desaturase family protein [Gammaproteobacteria bacterium]|nr:MAG: sterol desaturase family protein [Gammaproteobacteria bacterium]
MSTHTEVSEISSENPNTCLANIESTQTSPLEKNAVQLNALQRLCYPILLISALLTIGSAFYFDLNFGLCNVVFLLWAIAYLAICERLIPYEKEWHPTLAEWGRDGLYLVITMSGGALSVAAIYAIASVISPMHSVIPLWLEIPLALLLTSLGSYVFHRAGHEFTWLWRLHGIHHTVSKINVSNNALNHVLDVFGRRFLAQLPMLILGISQPALFIVSIFNTAQGYFAHANVDVRLGKLNYLVGGPEQHRLHHSLDIREAGHYSVDVPIWDLLFKSYFWKNGRTPNAVGIKNVTSFPPANAIFSNFLHPFVKKRNYFSTKNSS